MRRRTACCTAAGSTCGTRYELLEKWVGRHLGKAVRLVEVEGDEQGSAPFFAQPVGYDGRAFFILRDGLCDTEKLLHEACHFLVSPKERRAMVNYGLGPGPFRPVDDRTSDNEEVAASLLQRQLAPYFALPESALQAPDYNCANHRHLDWAACEAQAQAAFEAIKPRLEGIEPQANWGAAPAKKKRR
ncbi:MAG: hypothetical protein JNK72_05340 [Myxococcales bacterium]|nr:hypothetical protein [Myxococcales bacterium]